ncbi:MAG TPA: nucleotidyltransferase family protein [Pyrinomonadaceae bacterium]|nr:nucleotidyltransferase family protein [Pyrinomonadaceae bacterium]
MSFDSPLSNEIDDESRKWFILQRAVEQRSVAAAFDFFRLHGLEPILFKGIAAGLNYPEGKVRVSTDIDLAFSKTDFEKAFALAQSDEYKGTTLDIHREFKHLDKVDWNVLFDRSQVIELGGLKIRIPSAEDHLRLLCVHWLIDGGWFRERLWDIYYAVDRRSETFDWSRCLDEVSANRRGWVICTIGLAHHYLQLPIDDLPFADEARNVPTWLIRAVEREWASGLRLAPIQQFVGQPALFFRQLRKRLPPNPITATLDVEGSLDSRFRFHFQIGSILKRLGPSLGKFKSYFSR